MVIDCDCGICKRCKKLAYQKQWRKDNADRLRQYRQTPEYKARFQANSQKMVVSSARNFLQMLLHRAAYGKRKGGSKLVVSITLDDLLTILDAQGGKCAVTGLPMNHQRNSLKSISIDRLDNKAGYVPGNVHLVCRFVNIARQHFPLSDFRAVLDEYVSLRTAGR